ncbi:hypothetical protein DRN67_02140 [Candidatus Micrarchaeota archaeon]|nr:MAG: hypothetical protein DRN67_02140 [Candidatus Micrarchaeota archaeon]
MNMKTLHCFALAFLALMLAGCPTLEANKFDYTITDASFLAPDDCAACACLVCQRPDIEASAVEESPTGVSTGFLAQTGAGLVGTRCWFQPCGADLKQQIKDDPKLYQVPFKLGVGQDTGVMQYSTIPHFVLDDVLMGLASWQSREAARYSPITDKWCGFWAAGTKDRWQNVFRSYGFNDFFRLNCNMLGSSFYFCNYGTDPDSLTTWLEDTVKSATPNILQFEWMADDPTVVDDPLTPENEDDNIYLADHGLYGYPFPGFDAGVDSEFNGMPLPKYSDLLCLIQGPYEYLTAPGSPYYGAPPRLFCASGNCNKGRTYASGCRKDVDGLGLTYEIVDLDNPENFRPLDEVDCRCRTVRYYTNEEALHYPNELLDNLALTGGEIRFTAPEYTPSTSKKLLSGNQQWCRSYPNPLAAEDQRLRPVFIPVTPATLDPTQIQQIWNTQKYMAVADGDPGPSGYVLEPTDFDLEKSIYYRPELAPFYDACSTPPANPAGQPTKPVQAECAAYYLRPGTVSFNIGGDPYEGRLAYCIEWVLTDAGYCKVDDDGKLELNEYGVCEGCLPTSDLVLIGGTYPHIKTQSDLGSPIPHPETFGQAMVGDILGTWSMDFITFDRYVHGGFLQRNILPVIDERKIPDAWDLKRLFLEQTIPLIAASEAHPVIIVVDRSPSDYVFSHLDQVKDPSHCPSEFDSDLGVTKHACLVAIEDDWQITYDPVYGYELAHQAPFTDTPIPLDKLDDVDILVQDITLTGSTPCPDCPAFTGPSTNDFKELINTLIARAKYVQTQSDYIDADKYIGWLLFIKLPQSCCPYISGENLAVIERLSNAGYIAVIVSFEDPPAGELNSIRTPYLIGNSPPGSNPFNTLLWKDYGSGPEVSDNFDIQADPANRAFYNYFVGIANYYNGTHDDYFIKQSPVECVCDFCEAEDNCNAYSLLCSGTGLSCVSPTLEPIKDPLSNTIFKCTPGCIPFPNAVEFLENPEDPVVFDRSYVCTNDPEGTPGYFADVENGCYAICNVKLDSTGSLVPSTRGLVEPQDGYDLPDKLDPTVIHYTPTTCYMEDSTGNFYLYKKMRGGNPYHRAYPLFDTQGLDNLCGLSEIDLATIIAEQSEYMDLPAMVIK